MLLLPWDGEVPLLLVVRRGALPDADRCSVAVVNPSRAGTTSYHVADGRAPPKVKYGTALEIGDVPLSRLADEAWWVVFWFGVTVPAAEAAAGRLKRGPLAVLYEVLPPCLAGGSSQSRMISRPVSPRRCCCPTWRATRSIARLQSGRRRRGGGASRRCPRARFAAPTRVTTAAAATLSATCWCGRA